MNCLHCGQPIKDARKEVMNKKLLDGLRAAAQEIMTTGKNDFDLHNLYNDTGMYSNFQKLRFFGLVHHVTKNGRKVRGHWLITRNGWAFLRGERPTHKWVKVRDNAIVEHSPEYITIQGVHNGSDAIVTSFEYFDEYGTPIGIRPVMRDRQVVLL